MKRVMIVGQPGAGKSALAREVAEIAHLPVFHIDHVHWMPGWVERPRDEKTAMCWEIHALDRWVFEGGHSATWPERLARADALIWLDLPVGVRLARVARRALRSGQRPDLPPDCPERLDLDFLRFVWRTRDTGRAKLARLFDQARADQSAHHLRSAKAARGFVHALRYAARRGTLGISHR